MSSDKTLPVFPIYLRATVSKLARLQTASRLLTSFLPECDKPMYLQIFCFSCFNRGTSVINVFINGQAEGRTSFKLTYTLAKTWHCGKATVAPWPRSHHKSWHQKKKKKKERPHNVHIAQLTRRHTSAASVSCLSVRQSAVTPELVLGVKATGNGRPLCVKWNESVEEINIIQLLESSQGKHTQSGFCF